MSACGTLQNNRCCPTTSAMTQSGSWPALTHSADRSRRRCSPSCSPPIRRLSRNGAGAHCAGQSESGGHQLRLCRGGNHRLSVHNPSTSGLLEYFLSGLYLECCTCRSVREHAVSASGRNLLLILWLRQRAADVDMMSVGSLLLRRSNDATEQDSMTLLGAGSRCGSRVDHCQAAR